MKGLHRGPAPPSLAGFRHGAHTWSDVKSDHRQDIWRCLDAMQRGLCAYCEGRLESLGRHIDHHCRKSRHPRMTFLWSNLFGSCDRNDSCGHFKDRPGGAPYTCDQLLDPCTEDPDEFLVIRDSGRIEARSGLAEAERTRAETTLRVLNLNLDQHYGGRSLCAERRRVLEFFLAREPDILEALSDWNEDDRTAYVQSEIDIAAQTEFGSIVRHFFQRP